MAIVPGPITPRGIFLEAVVSPTPQLAAQLQAGEVSARAAVIARALVNTGADASAVDLGLIARLRLRRSGQIALLSPATGSVPLTRDRFDAEIRLGPSSPSPKGFRLPLIGLDLKGQGFDAIIGWDILSHCRLECDGPNRQFVLTY